MILDADSNTEGLVFDVQRFAIHDGPGIRTIVFFKGCPLHCLWCQNPEGMAFEAEILRDPAKCCNCAQCAAACPAHKIAVHDAIEVTPVACLPDCSLCAEVCPSGAVRRIGVTCCPSDLLAFLLRDKPFFDVSGGGVTFSGGEPLHQIPFVVALLKLLKENRVNTLVETAGFVPWQNIEAVLGLTDILYFDLKILDADAHRRYTGSDNTLILENLRRLYSLRAKGVTIRIPLIPGVSDTEENLAALADWLHEEFNDGFGVCLLPYNWLAPTKYNYVCIRGTRIHPYQLGHLKPQTYDNLLGMKRLFTDRGIAADVPDL